MTNLVPGLQKVTAPNGSVMTGAGTNCWIIGDRQKVVIDPGPDIAEHIDALEQAGAGAISHILVTHTHRDHSPAVAELKRRTGAVVCGAVLDHNDGFQDTTFVADQPLREGEPIVVGDATIEPIHTPGHVENHFCFHWREQGVIFTGDHLMQGSTVVIIPPAGDMYDYLHSLEKLLPYQPHYLAPGHGDLMPDCRAVIEGVIAHRLKRERKVVEVMQRIAPASLDALLAQVYDDVVPEVVTFARLSLWAHLRKLAKDGRAVEQPQSDNFADAIWSLSETA